MASRYPDLVRRMVDEGHEIGLHTFNHPDLSYQSKKRIDWELTQNQLALAGAAGIRTSLFRPPYSSTADALDNASWPVTEYVGTRGYLTVFTTADSEDWQRPGVRQIIRNATPHGRQGRDRPMHDSGGDRHQTVEALDTYLPELQGKGYRFENLTEALHAPSAHTPVTGIDLWKGKAWVFLVAASDDITGVLVVGLAVIGVLVFARFGLMLLLSATHTRRTRRKGFVWGPTPVTEPVSVLVPAYNEAKCIENTVRSLMRSEHPIEVIVIDDGSSDGTARIVEDLRLPERPRRPPAQRGQARRAQHGASRNARHDLIVMMDGDTVFEPATVRELVQPFADPEVGAVAGNAKVGNRDTLIGAWQHIEYVMGFNLDRRMYDVLRCMPTIPGAVGAFRRSALDRVGGMSDDTLAEDTDITMAIHRDGWHVVYAEKARAWTEAPESVQQLWSQRYRWCYGTMQAIWKHRRALVEGGASGRFGRVGLPLVSLFMVVAPLLAPLIDLFLVYGLVFGPTGRTVAAWFGVLAVQAGCAAYAFRARQGAAHPADLPPAPADAVPPADVHRPAPVLDHRPHRRPAALAEAAPQGAGGRTSGRAGREPGRRNGPVSTHPTETTAELPELPGPPTQNTVPAAREDGAGEAGGKKKRGGRDRYFDLLRAVALFRVVLYHLMGWAWLPVVFPSMGVMFALAGDLMARSLSRRPALEVARGRLRRLLPPLWLLGAVGVTGHARGRLGPGRRGAPRLVVVPPHLLDPAGERPAVRRRPLGHSGLDRRRLVLGPGRPLWYIRAYLWFVLLSPLLLRALRRLPWPTILAPIGLCAALEFGALTVPSWRLESNLSDFGTFGACWLLGMARQEGVLRRLPRYVVPSLAPAVAALGLWYALSHDLREGHDLDDMPFGQSLWSFAAVLLLLHISPSWSEWPARLRRWDRLITLLNSRAVTIYLWHNVCITVVEGLWDRLWDVPWLEADAPWILQSPWPQLPAVWLLTAVCVVCFGWVEDLAARRRPRLWPDGRTGTHRA